MPRWPEAKPRRVLPTASELEAKMRGVAAVQNGLTVVGRQAAAGMPGGCVLIAG